MDIPSCLADLSIYNSQLINKVPQKLRDLSQRLQNLFIARPFSIVHLDKTPTYHSLLVDHVGCRVWPAAAIGIENTVAVDNLMAFVFEQGKIELSRVTPLLELLHKPLRILMRVNADPQDLNSFLFFLSQKALQLPELRSAVGSPMAAIKNQDYIFPALEIRQRNSLSVHILQCKIWRLIPNSDPFQIGGLQASPVLGAQLSVEQGNRKKGGNKKRCDHELS